MGIRTSVNLPERIRTVSASSGIALRESSEDSDRDNQSPSIPTRAQLYYQSCGDETKHRFNTHESIPDDT